MRNFKFKKQDGSVELKQFDNYDEAEKYGKENNAKEMIVLQANNLINGRNN